MILTWTISGTRLQALIENLERPEADLQEAHAKIEDKQSNRLKKTFEG